MLGDTGDVGLIPGLGRSPRGEYGNPLLLEKSQGQRSLVGYSSQGCKELDMTEQLSMHIHLFTHSFIHGIYCFCLQKARSREDGINNR